MKVKLIDIRIKDLKKEEEKLTVARSRIRGLIAGLRLEKAELEHGVKIGSIVSYHGKDHKVISIDASWRDKPWLVGHPKKKDGSFGTAKRNLYGYWELKPQDNLGKLS